jgi:hypothetical protein
MTITVLTLNLLSQTGWRWSLITVLGFFIVMWLIAEAVDWHDRRASRRKSLNPPAFKTRPWQDWKERDVD